MRKAMDGRVHTLPELIRAITLFGPALAAAGVAAALLDPQGRLVRCNTAMTRVLGGRSVADVQGDTLLTWLKQLEASARTVECPCLVVAPGAGSEPHQLPPEPYRLVISTSHEDLLDNPQPDPTMDSLVSVAMLARASEPPGRAEPGATAYVSRPRQLSKREWDIVRGLLAYQPLSEVSSVLGISIHTVRNHLKSIFRKMHVTSRHELLQVVSSGAADARSRPA
jgi:DNA-binding CsgD family transcriptional regulator